MNPSWLSFTRSWHALRDHTGETDLAARAGIKVGIRTELEPPEVDGKLIGTGFLESLFYARGEEPKDPGRRFGGGFALLGGELEAEGVRPYRNADDLELDDRYEHIEIEGDSPWPIRVAGALPAIGPGPDPMVDPELDDIKARAAGRPIPDGHPLTLRAATEELEQHLVAAMDWAGLVVADHRGKDDGLGFFSSALIDVDAAGKLDKERIAPLHSALRSSHSWDGNTQAALYFASRPHEPGLGGGMFWSQGLFSKGVRGLAYASWDFFGPLCSGAGEGDKHLIGLNRDGEGVTQGHLWLGAPWFVDNVRDAPPEYYLEAYEEPQRTGVWSEVRLCYDGRPQHPAYRGLRGGLQRWEARSNWRTLPPPRVPPQEEPLPPLPPLGDPELPPTVERPDGSRGPGVIVTGPAPSIPDPDLWTDFELRERLTCWNESWMEVVAPAFLGKPSPIGCPDEDLRNVANPNQEQVDRIARERPFGWKEESFGSFIGCEPIYNQRPEDDTRQYLPGTLLRAGRHLMPAEISLDHIKLGIVSQIAANTETGALSEVASSVHSDYGWRVHGEPLFSDTDEDIPGLWAGFGWRRRSSTDELELHHADGYGDRDLIYSIPSTGPNTDLFGDGSGGDESFGSGPDALSGDHAVYYSSLELADGAIVDTGGRVVFVNGTLTIGDGAQLHTDGTAGDDGSAGGLGGSAPASSYYGSNFAGGDGGVDTVGTGANGVAGNGGSASLGSSGTNGGGATVGATIVTAAAGGSVTAAKYKPRTAAQILAALDEGANRFRGGGSGAGGGAVGTAATGGGGGASGGLLAVFCHTLVLHSNGLITARGGDGGDGYVTGGGNQAAGGGGAGGGGGVMLFFRFAYDENGARLTKAQVSTQLNTAVSPGSPGSGSSSGTGSAGNGSTGSGGFLLVVEV